MSDGRKHIRWDVLMMVRNERERQVGLYGLNGDNELGFGGSVSDHPWLMPYTADPSGLVEHRFRSDYENYEREHGKPTWMHLIREEVAELFTTERVDDTVIEAVQVAALCVSLVEHLLIHGEEVDDVQDN